MILASSHLGFALSTTHVATGSILGAGVGRGTKVRWNLAGRMVAAWAVTFPAAAVVGAAMILLAKALGDGLLGALVVFALLLGFSIYMWRKSQESRVDHSNVTAEWDHPDDVLEHHAPNESADSFKH